MHKTLGMLLCLCIILMVSGCETCKGMKQDMHNVFGPGGQMEKADKWIKKNLW